MYLDGRTFAELVACRNASQNTNADDFLSASESELELESEPESEPESVSKSESEALT